MKIVLGIVGLSLFINCQAGFTQEKSQKQSQKLYQQISVQYDSFTNSQLSQVYRLAIENEVADTRVLGKYDKNEGHEGEIGFCYGRAMGAHLIAKKMGVKDSSVKKLFIIGDMRSLGWKNNWPEWRFHVTTIVKGPEGVWYAIDPITISGFNRRSKRFNPPTVAKWVSFVREGWDSWHGEKYKSKLVLTDTSMIFPDIRTLNNPETGTNIIDLNFNFEKNEVLVSEEWSQRFGLLASTNPIHLAFGSKGQEYFLTTDEERDEDRFNFNELKINVFVKGGDTIKIHYKYFNYFSDLLTSINNLVLEESTEENVQKIRLLTLAALLIFDTTRVESKPSLKSFRLPRPGK